MQIPSDSEKFIAISSLLKLDLETMVINENDIALFIKFLLR